MLLPRRQRPHQRTGVDGATSRSWRPGPARRNLRISPGGHAGYRYLHILEVKAYRAKAEERHRRVFAGPTATEADRQEAAAILALWREKPAQGEAQL
ncbi:hypothetical protein Aab01nite_09350 [Paractinoplanes abujensis]|uniref:Uncharacterized protein n=1 Tax=Paractinoplanes abujensis TaxID=882441 RepID=A0A7W7G054_9ACTN|nr:hypothetical protein [Actinoplanes abujensis]MBB4691239.1 hypothetical protein [Actinoplanes abujensis]GID17345.1 hypothetical protein Aab01nite_09350 [Actinoplanes abujensis]